MALVQNCVLCLSNDPKCFLEVSCENNEAPNKEQIITKHLAFDLKLTPQSHVCVQCWKSVYDFHLFYCKVQTIHSEKRDEPNLASNTANNPKSNKEEEDYVFGSFSAGIIKAEPLEVHSDRDDAEPEESYSNVPNSSTTTDQTIERTKHTVNPPERFKPDRSNDLIRYERRRPYLEVKVVESNESEPDQDSVGSNRFGDALSGDDTEPMVVPPKKRRGRPPKQKVVKEEKPVRNDNTTAVTKETPDIWKVKRLLLEENVTDPNESESNLRSVECNPFDDALSGSNTEPMVEPPNKRRGRPPKRKVVEKEKLARNVNTAAVYKETPHRTKGKRPLLEEQVADPNESEPELGSVGSNHFDDALSGSDTEPMIVPPKKRRGRPPKQNIEEEKTAQTEKTTAVTVLPKETVPPKKRRGRPPKQKPSENVASKGVVKRSSRPRKSINYRTSESEQEDGSDFETELSQRSKRIGGKRPPQGTRFNGPHERDEKIFAYIDEFACDYCEEKVLFERFSEATRHYKDVHMERAFLKCPKCYKKTYTSGEFVSHVETHNNPDRCKCKICGKMTVSRIALNKHMRCHQVDLEGNYPFPCRMCSRRFEEESGRDKHEQLHRPKPIVPKQYGRDEAMLEFYRRIYCDVCEETKPKSTSFDNFWDLKVHMNKEHSKSPYLKCPLCYKKMGVRHQIMMHIDVHRNPELYRCEVCSEIHQYLDRHMIAAHTPTTGAPDKKRYNCEHCDKVFRFRWKLKYHINEAHGLKDVSCDICKKFFTRPALAAHKRKAHLEGEATYLCDHCPKLFHKPQSLRTHIAFAHENRRTHKKCPLCGKEVSGLSKHMMMVHPRDGPTTCDLCGKRFRSSFHMRRHRVNTCEATMNSRPYKCEICGKGFCLKLTMIEHMTTHTRTNLYQCAFCLKTYGYLSNLQKHRKKAHPVEWQQVQGDQSIVTVIQLDGSDPVPATANENTADRASGSDPALVPPGNPVVDQQIKQDR